MSRIRDYTHPVLGHKRDKLIIDAVRCGHTASVHELAARLNVSASTIRRDLRRLDRNGELRRVYGGAIADGEPAETPFAIQDRQDSTIKDAVAARAAALVADDDVVLLDIGTTAMRVARHLRGRRITVITNNLGVLDELRTDHAVRLVLLGGVLRRNYQSMVGALTAEAIGQVSADRLFLGCTGVRDDGIVDDMEVEAPVKRAMIGVTRSVVALATDGKFPGTGSLRLCDPSEVDFLVTNEGSNETILASYRTAGSQVITV